jgi:hypothetical protein
MKKFRLPRKIKKQYKYKRFFLPPDTNGSREMVDPTNSQEEYDVVRKGIATDLLEEIRRNTRNYFLNRK